MQDFDYIKPHTIEELSSLLSDQGGNPKILSGGTDLINQLTDDKITTDLIIDIKAIPEVNQIKFDQAGLFIGSAVTCHDICSNIRFKDSFPGLYDSFSLIGGHQIQDRATIGGNLCNSSPAADSIPALIVHNAKCLIASTNENHELNVEDFCLGPGKNILQKTEFLQGIRIPEAHKGFGACYQRFIPRNEMDIAVVGVGSSVSVDEKTGKIKSARIALGAVGPTPLYIKEAESLLIGQSVNDKSIEEKIKEVAEQAKKLAQPITDMRGSAEQRKHLTEVLTRRTLTIAIERAKKSLEV